MNKKWIPVIVAVISLFGLGGAAVYNIQIGDTNISESNIETNIEEGDTTINIGDIISDGLVDRATITIICLQDPIPKAYITACAER